MADHPLKQSIIDVMKDAMRAKDKPRLSTIRLMLSALNRIEVDERIDLSKDRIISILDKMIKQRRDSIKQYTNGDRKDLADIEIAEIEVIQEFMPSSLSEEEIAVIITKAITESGATSMRDIGKVINIARPQLFGRADMAMVSQLTKQQLS